MKIIINISIEKNKKSEEKNVVRKKQKTKIKKIRKKIIYKKMKEEKLKNKKQNKKTDEKNKKNLLKIFLEKNNLIIKIKKIFFFDKDNLKNKIQENKILKEGIFSKKDYLTPSYINLNNPKFFEVEEMFYSTLLCVNYFREQNDLILKSLIDSNINLNISIFYEKQDTYKTIKELTYHIGNIGVELKENDSNREDMDLAAFSFNDAKYIRKEMQLNNEELYYMYIYLTVFAKDKKELEYLLNKVEGIAESKGIRNKKSLF